MEDILFKKAVEAIYNHRHTNDYKYTYKIAKDTTQAYADYVGMSYMDAVNFLKEIV